jgi:hypothetical protein
MTDMIDDDRQADYLEHLRAKYGGQYPISAERHAAYVYYLDGLPRCSCGQPLLAPVSVARGHCEACHHRITGAYTTAAELAGAMREAS